MVVDLAYCIGVECFFFLVGAGGKKLKRTTMKIENENHVPCEREKLYYHFDGNEWSQKWEEKFELSDLVHESSHQELEKIRQQICEGVTSPLAYHIHKYFSNYGYILTGCSASIKLLSSYTGISKRHIKRHLKPSNFNQLDEDTLKKYAEVFDISIEELINV
jgi:hypothetical protein